MRPQEAAIYKEIQRNMERAVKAIDILSDKVYNEELSGQMSRQSLKYNQLRGKAMEALLDGKAEPYHANQISDTALKAGLNYNTLLNTSTGHIAELLIKERNNEILALEKVLRHNEEAGEKPRALAKELMEYDEKCITTLKNYL